MDDQGLAGTNNIRGNTVLTMIQHAHKHAVLDNDFACIVIAFARWRHYACPATFATWLSSFFRRSLISTSYCRNRKRPTPRHQTVRTSFSVDHVLKLGFNLIKAQMLNLGPIG